MTLRVTNRIPFLGPLRAATWMTAVGSLACSSGLVPPDRPSRGGPAWYEVAGEHFVLRTDMRESDAARAASALEQAYAELHAEWSSTADPRGPALHVVAFRDEAEMDRYWAPRRGFYSPRLPGDLEREPTIVMVRAEGSELFDAMALESFARAAPFGAPPDDIRSGDGLVHVHWLLSTDEVRACSTMNARPFLLE